MDEEFADVYYVDARNAPYRPESRYESRHPARVPWPRPRHPQAGYVPGRQPAVQQYAQPMIYQSPMQTSAATLLGKLTTGQIVEMVAQVFAALQSLPGAPVATRDVATDVSNMILYQDALAQHAKRDEQVRTLGGLVARLVG